MKTFSNSLLLVRLVCSCVMLVALYLCLGAPVYAQTSTCPVGDAGTNANRGKGDDIQCRVNNVLNSNQALLNSVKAHAANCQGPHCDLLQDMVTNAQHAHDKAVKAHGRMKGSDYDDLNTLRKEKCMGSRSACGQGNGTYSGGDSDPTVGQDVADNLDDATNALDKANKEMQDPQTASSLLAAVPTSATDPIFQSVYTGDGSSPSDPKYPTPFWMTNSVGRQLLNPYGRFSTIIAVGVLDFVTKFNQNLCRQVLVVAGEGGNASDACAVFTIAYFAGKTTLDALNFEGSYTASYASHVAVDNEAILNANIALVDAKAGNTQAAISALQDQVTALQTSVNALQTQLTSSTNLLSQKSNVSTDMDKQIMQLLLSPDGRRSLPASLLTCTGDSSTSSPCPPVAITCSATTGSCSFNSH